VTDTYSSKNEAKIIVIRDGGSETSIQTGTAKNICLPVGHSNPFMVNRITCVLDCQDNTILLIHILRIT
jgi:hypothetical protein